MALSNGIAVKKEDIQRITDNLMTTPSLDEAVSLRHLEFSPLVHLAFDLCSDLKTGREIKTSLQLGKISKIEALSQILTDWVSGNGEDATFEKLSEVLSANGLVTMAAKAKDMFEKECAKIKIKNKIRSSNRKIQKIGQKGQSSSSTREVVEEVKQHERTPQEKALTNPVILEEILKWLPFQDKKTFRLVNRLWCTETLGLWRRSTWTTIWLNTSNFQLRRNMHGFLEFMKQEPNQNCGRAAKKTNNNSNEVIISTKLRDKHFRCISIEVCICSLRSVACKRTETNLEESFWNSYGPQITCLQLRDFFFYFGKTPNSSALSVLRKLLLEFCPNLQELYIHDSRYILSTDYPDSGGETKNERRKLKNSIAGNLHTLHIERGGLQKGQLKEILKFCPKIKNLSLKDKEELEGLVLPTVNGDHVKLERLKLDRNLSNVLPKQMFQDLRNYVEQFPNSIRHLEFTHVGLKTARSAPFNLYASLAQCLQLKTLKLDIYVLPDTSGWFMDLSPFSFPNLKYFKITFKISRRDWGDERRRIEPQINFDFATFKGMPNLEEAEVMIGYRKRNDDRVSYTIREQQRVRDFVYDGPRHTYDYEPPSNYPCYRRNFYIFCEDDPISCKNLRRFTFDGWNLQNYHIELLSIWFPNLTHLSIHFGGCFRLTTAMNPCKNLKSLHLRRRSDCHLECLRELKEELPDLEVIQEFEDSKFGSMKAVKCPNGRILFDKLCVESRGYVYDDMP